MRKIWMLLCGTSLLTQAHAFPCYITLVKDNCWAEYDVNVDITDVMTNKVIATLNMPKGKSWARQQLVCQPKQTVSLAAKFSPAIWDKDEGKIYNGKRFWSFPETINKGDTAWNMTICYADAFSGLPSPANVKPNCTCDVSMIPVIKPN